MPIENNAKHLRTIAFHNHKNEDDFVKYVNKALDIIHEGRPHKTYKGGALPPEFTKALIEESKINTALTNLVASLTFVSRNSEALSTKNKNELESEAEKFSNLVELNAAPKSNVFQFKTETKNHKLSTIFNAMQLLQNGTPPTSHALLLASQSEFKNFENTQTDFEVQKSSRFDMGSTCPANQKPYNGSAIFSHQKREANSSNNITDSSHSPESFDPNLNNLRIKACELPELDTNESEGRTYRAAVQSLNQFSPNAKDSQAEDNFDKIINFRTQNDPLTISMKSFFSQTKGLERMLLKFHFALYESRNPSINKYFVRLVNDDDNEEFSYLPPILGLYNAETDAISLSQRFSGLPQALKKSLLWHELKHREMFSVAENGPAFNEDIAPQKSSHFEKWETSGAVEANFKLSDGDVKTRDAVDKACKIFYEGLKNAVGIFKENPHDERIKRFFNIIEPENFHIKNEFMESKNITQILKEHEADFFCIYIGKLKEVFDLYYAVQRTPDSIENDGKTTNGECILNVMDRHLPYKGANSIINHFLEIFAPNIENNQSVGTLLSSEAKKYENRFIKLALEETNVFDFLLTLEEKLYVAFSITNPEIETADLNNYVQNIIKLTDDTQKRQLDAFLSLYKKGNFPFKIVSPESVPKVETSTSFGSVVYDYKENQIYIIDTFFFNVINSPKATQLKIADDFMGAIRSASLNNVASVFSSSPETKSYVSNPTAIEDYINIYKDVLRSSIQRLRADISAPGKSQQYYTFLEPIIKENFFQKDSALLRYLEAELARAEDISKSKNYNAFIANLSFGNSLEKLGNYSGSRNGNKMKTMWAYINSLRIQNEQTLRSDDFKRKKIIFSLFDLNVYSREDVVNVINDLPIESQKSLISITRRINNFQFNDPSSDRFGSLKFSTIIKSKERSREKEEFKRDNGGYVETVLYEAFSEKFDSETRWKLINLLKVDPKLDALMKAILEKKKGNPNEPFFFNPSAIFILDGKIYFNIENLEGKQSKALGDCLDVFRDLQSQREKNQNVINLNQNTLSSQNCNPFSTFKNEQDVVKCAVPEDSKNCYIIKPSSENEDVLGSRFNYEPSKYPVPEIDEGTRKECSNLAIFGAIPSDLNTPQSERVKNLLNCVKNKEDAPSVLSNFGFYPENKPFQPNLGCKLNKGEITCMTKS